MNTSDRNGFCATSSSTPFTIPGRGGSVLDVQPIRAVSPVLATSHLQPASVPLYHRHPVPYTPYVYPVFDTVEVGRKIEQAIGMRGQNQQNPILVPDIPSSAQAAQMGADENLKMEAAKGGFNLRNQLGIGKNNQVSSKNDPVPVLTQMHGKINYTNVSDVDFNKRQEGYNQIPREVRTERIQVEKAGNGQNHCSIHNPSYLQRAMNFTASTSGNASVINEKVGSGLNSCPLHASMLRQINMNVNANSAPVNQNHCESRGSGESFQMGTSQSQYHPQLRYSIIGQFPEKFNNPNKAPSAEPVTLETNSSPLAAVKTEYGTEISAGAKGGKGNSVGLVTVKTEYGSESTAGVKEGGGNSVGLVTVKTKYGSESTAGAKEVKGNSVGLVTVKKEYGSEITAGAKEGKGNSVGLVTVKNEYGSEVTAGAKEGKGNSAGLVTVKKEYGSEITAAAKEGGGNSVGLVTVKKEYGNEISAEANEGRWNSVRPAESGSLTAIATTNAENWGGMAAMANSGGNVARVTESPQDNSQMVPRVIVGQSNATEMLESASNMFNITALRTDSEKMWHVTPEANTQREIVPLQEICSINPQELNVDQLRCALAMSLSRFKDLTVLGMGAMTQSHANLLADTATCSKKRKRSIKQTFIIRATEENALSNSDDRERVRKALMTFDALRRNLMNDDESWKEAGGGSRRADLKAGTTMMDRGQWINRGRRFIGSVPGVHVGDHFYFRMELCVIGLHGPSQAGIDFITAKNSQWNEPVAISIVSSGGYEDDEDGGDVLIYSGQGGNNYIMDKKESVDQKLERGNLGLERSMHYGVEIRVIRGIKDSKSPSGKIYIYDGLYKIEHSWLEKGRSGCGVFKYKLQRIPGQPELGSAILKNTRVWKSQPLSREGLLHPDMSLRSEKLPVCLVNNVDNDKGPPHFEYASRLLRYQSSLVQLDSFEGCACIGVCDPSNCLCAHRNGNQMPYNSNGILIKEKPLIYECNDQCRCPLSCRNRVTQRGLSVYLEVFRTNDKRWGVRSWDPIAAGTFISEYTGKVVPVDEQADPCHSNNEYVLNLKHAQKRRTEWGSVSETLCEQEQQQQKDGSIQAFPPVNFFIDANNFGNVLRFIKHSSYPNLLMQFVLNDHLDIRFPHTMLFAKENIPPLTELTFDYGSALSSVLKESGESSVLALIESVPEHNQSAIKY